MIITRRSFLDRLEATAKSTASLSLDGSEMSEQLLTSIVELYEAAKIEKTFEQDASFEVAYHSPITSDLEFLAARILFHYSLNNDLNWKILLRRQVGKTAPDIRIEINGKTLAVVEIKAKAGWMQPFFSSDRYEKDMARLQAGTHTFDPEVFNETKKQQLTKYHTTFHIEPDAVFVLLPTLALVHRKSSKTNVDGYRNVFAKNSGLPCENLVLLSNNPELDLSYRVGKLEPSGDFERMLKLLVSKTRKISNELESSDNQDLGVDRNQNGRGEIDLKNQINGTSTNDNGPTGRFLSGLVEKGKDRCPVTRRMKVTDRQYIGASAGFKGMRYYYGIYRDRTHFEVFISTGNKAENKRLYDRLASRKHEIEGAFGASLFWQRLDKKDCCRIAFRIPGGITSPETAWSAMQDELINGFLKFRRALEPHLRII